MTEQEREVARDLFPRCPHCGLSILRTAVGDLVEVSGREHRLAHRDCLAAEAEEPSDAAD
jgi:hypothetical protein